MTEAVRVESPKRPDGGDMRLVEKDIDLLRLPFEFYMYYIGEKGMVLVPDIDKKSVFH